MNRRVSVVLAAAVLLSGAAALSAEEAGSSPPASTSTEKSTTTEGENCLALHQIESTKVLDDRTILFELKGGRTMVNRLPHRCGGLGFEKRFGYKTSISQLCSQDIIWVITEMGGGLDRGASCGLGKFEAYVAPEADDAPGDKGKLEPR